MTGASAGEAGRVRVATVITRLVRGVRRAAGSVRHGPAPIAVSSANWPSPVLG
jgi:hypothetical protein